MPRTWKALPDPKDPLKLLKAPDYQTYEDQADLGDQFRWPKRVTIELEVAKATLETILGMGVEVGQAQEYRIWRYAQGLAMETPSGWVVYTPFAHSSDGKRLRAEAVAAGKIPAAEGADKPKPAPRKPKPSPKVDPEGVPA
jgi:hypothetical protein